VQRERTTGFICFWFRESTQNPGKATLSMGPDKVSDGSTMGNAFRKSTATLFMYQSKDLHFSEVLKIFKWVRSPVSVFL